MSILVTGGAGYIGSHTVAYLREQGEDVVVIDNLSSGHRSAVRDVPFYVTDIHDAQSISNIIRTHHVDSVIHFAAHSLVSESMKMPLKYYRNNVAGSMSLLQTLIDNQVYRIVFSSTAAVYGEPSHVPISEGQLTAPTNTYGDTKLAIEKMLQWVYRAHGVQSISLRYFNAAGAHPDGTIGEDHRPETHLIPIILQAALGQREFVEIFGDDYDTPDGTCIRDYVHVMDLASAHYGAVVRLRESGGCDVMNLGIGHGYTVQQVIDAARHVTGHSVPTVNSPRRSGDPAVLVASSARAKQLLNWSPQYTELQEIIASAWRWHEAHPQGYEPSPTME